ncbi:MAG: GAF domain-containing protein [Gemmatimonadetes bacterium]|nr:GAF domain-containing protein [Gemmatimonadota bacterium]
MPSILTPVYVPARGPTPQPDVAALEAIDAAPTPDARARVAATQLHALGFAQAVVTLRDAALHPSFSATAGVADDDALAPALQPFPPAVWRRYLPQLERFRVGDVHWLDRQDPWVAREFFGHTQAGREGASAEPSGLVLGLLRGGDSALLGTVMLLPAQGSAPTPELLRAAGNLVRHLGARLGHDLLQALADRRQARLQRLQEAAASLTRSLDEGEVLRELVRHVQRAIPADGVAVFAPDLAAGTLTTLLRVVHGVDWPHPDRTLPEGIVAEVARTGQMLRAGDRDADRQRERAQLRPLLPLVECPDLPELASVVAAPLRVGSQLLGVLVAFHAERGVYGDEDEDVMATLAALAATAVTNARRYAESERERRTTEALADVARAVGESLRPGEVLRLILRHAVSLLGVEGAMITLREQDYLHIVAGVGSAGMLAGVHLPVDGCLFGQVVRDHEQLLLNDTAAVRAGLASVERLAPIDRLLSAPLVTSRGAIGAIAAFNRARPFGDDELRLLQRLADQVAVAIVNARLFDEVERATREWRLVFDASASGMLLLLEEGHTVRRCNSRAAALFGREIMACLGRPLLELLEPVAPGGSSMVERLARAAMASGQPMRDTLRIPAGGALQVQVAPLPGTAGVVTLDEVPESALPSRRLAAVG